MKKIVIKSKFENDWISREAGEKLRLMILDATSHNEPVEIDFSDIVIASTSFLDEGFAKLAQHDWTEDKLLSLIRLKKIHPRDREILEALFQKRRKES